MIGKILKDRYKILSNVGIGGMAYVYEAEDLILKRKVAVKVLKNEFLGDEEFLKKFQMEAQIAASINHPNIVNIYDVGEEEIDGNVKNYIIMEYVEGSTLKDIIRKEAPLDEKTVSNYSFQIASALKKAHEGGLIHRDIKPSNILITKQGEIKVTDFGIARLISGATVTYTTSILGTVHYISPEQAKGQAVGAKSDLYSLGVVMYEMVTGKVPFDADNSVGIALQHIQEKPQNIKEINPNLSQGMINIINKLLEKNPDDRFDSAVDLMHALENYRSFALNRTLSNKRVSDDTIILEKPQTSYYETKKEDNSSYQDDNSSDNKSKWIILGICLFLLFTAGIFFTVNYINQNRLEASITRVPNLINISEDDALDLLRDAELEANIKDRVYSDEFDEGFVIEQSIKKGKEVKKGTEIDITISLGKELVVVPNLKDLTLDEARKELQENDLTYSGITYEKSDEVEEKHVIRTIPEQGEKVEKDTAITLVVSEENEIETVYVPNLENRTLEQAIQIIQDENLIVGKIEREFNDNIGEGRVISQSPDSGDKVKLESPINLLISKGREVIEKPPKQDEEKPNNNDFTILVPIPENIEEDTFNIKIYNQSNNNELIFNKDYKSEELSGGILKVKVKTDKETKLSVFLNDREIEFSIE